MSYIETEKVELKRILNDTFEKEVVAFLNSLVLVFFNVYDSFKL